jgi:RsiW-degrading membrane proteinase PrsW (M82 family)
MDATTTIFLSFLAGFLPAIIWLFYFLWEDRKNPEPGWRIFSCFAYGMLAIPFAMLIQYIIKILVLEGGEVYELFFSNYFVTLLSIVAMVATEEILKYIAAYKGGISKKSNNEPLDPIIYVITAAIGFAALENTLYVLDTLLASDTYAAVLTGKTRFIGSTLLHIASSGIIGLFIAFSYYKKDSIKKTYLFYGIFLSIVLHTLFNSFIIKEGNFALVGFITVWVSIIAIIILFEKVKKIISPNIKI